jgi:AraC-like DNA-binding protein
MRTTAVDEIIWIDEPLDRLTRLVRNVATHASVAHRLADALAGICSGRENLHGVLSDICRSEAPVPTVRELAARLCCSETGLRRRFIIIFQNARCSIGTLLSVVELIKLYDLASRGVKGVSIAGQLHVDYSTLQRSCKRHKNVSVAAFARQSPAEVLGAALHAIGLAGEVSDWEPCLSAGSRQISVKCVREPELPVKLGDRNPPECATMRTRP